MCAPLELKTKEDYEWIFPQEVSLEGVGYLQAVLPSLQKWREQWQLWGSATHVVEESHLHKPPGYR